MVFFCDTVNKNRSNNINHNINNTKKQQQQQLKENEHLRVPASGQELPEASIKWDANPMFSAAQIEK